MYETAPEADGDTYLSRLFAPAIPLILWGRSASAFPPTPKEQTVWCWWRDHTKHNIMKLFDRRLQGSRSTARAVVQPVDRISNSMDFVFMAAVTLD